MAFAGASIVMRTGRVHLAPVCRRVWVPDSGRGSVTSQLVTDRGACRTGPAEKVDGGYESGDTRIWRGFGAPGGSEVEAGVRGGEGAEELLVQAWCSQLRRSPAGGALQGGLKKRAKGRIWGAGVPLAQRVEK